MLQCMLKSYVFLKNTFKIVKTCNFRKLYLPWFFTFFQSVEGSGSEILWRLTHCNIIFAKKNILVCQNLEFLKKVWFSKNQILISKIFLKIEKNFFSNFLFFHLVVYSLRFPKWVYLSKLFKKFRSYIFICKSSHIFSIADLGLLSYSYASMCTGVLAISMDSCTHWRATVPQEA